MKIVAYSYTDPLLESPPNPDIWGWEIDEIYQDLGERTQLQQLLKKGQNTPVDYLLIRRFEELGETVEQVCQHLLEIEALGIQIIALETEMKLQNSTLQKVEFLQFLNEIQKNQQSRQIRQGHARNRLKALPPPGKAPFGYRRGKDRYALDRTAAPIVKDFFEHFLIYGSLRGAVRYLEQKHSKKISVATGRNWLINPVYRGDLEYQNGQVISNTHVAIISREESAQIERILRRNRPMSPRTASSPRSLSGLVQCGECQSPMTIVRVTTFRKNREYLYLRPMTCPHQSKCKSIPYEQVLEKTIDGICQDLPQAVAGIKMPNMEVLKQEIANSILKKQQTLQQLEELILTEVLDPETAQLRAYKLRTEITELQGQLAQLPPVNLREIAQTVSIPQFWLDLSESERRFYFREFIRQIQINRQLPNWKLKVFFIF